MATNNRKSFLWRPAPGKTIFEPGQPAHRFLNLPMFPMNRFLLLPAFSLAAFLSMTARAELIVVEAFDYPPAEIVKQNGGEGWAGPWEGGRNDVQAESLSALYGETPKTSGGALTINKPDWGSVRALANPLGEKSGTYYISLLIRNDIAVSKENYGGVTFLPEEGKSGGFGIGQKYFGRVWSIQSPKDTAATNAESANSEAAFCVAKVTYSDKPEDDSILLFVNPDLAAEPKNPDAEVTGLDLDPITKIRLQARMPFTVDELRIGETWADVCPKPAA